MILLSILLGVLLVFNVALGVCAYFMYVHYNKTISELNAEIKNITVIAENAVNQSKVTAQHVDTIAMQTSKQIARCEQVVNANTRAVNTINHGFQTYSQAEMMYMG